MAERQKAFDKIGWHLLEKLSTTHWQIAHKKCGGMQRYAIASVMNTGLKPRCNKCLDIARKQALTNVGYVLGERVKGAKFNITHAKCGTTFPYKVSSVVALGTTPTCPRCAGFEK